MNHDEVKDHNNYVHVLVPTGKHSQQIEQPRRSRLDQLSHNKEITCYWLLLVLVASLY